MKSNIVFLQNEIRKIESRIRRHGFWRLPSAQPVHVRLSGRVTPEAQAYADLLNRILLIRCLPIVARIFGPAKPSTGMAFAKECRSDREKMEFVRLQFNQLISDLQSLDIFKNPPLEKIAA